MASPPVEGDSASPGVPGITGTNTAEIGLTLPGQAPPEYPGVAGSSQKGVGVIGQSVNGNGVQGTTGNSNSSGVVGVNTGGGNGVYGTSVSGNAVAGKSQTGNAGWFESSGAGDGVYGESQTGNGVQGTTGNSNSSGVVGVNTGGGNGVYGTSVSGNAVAGHSQTGNAGWFDGGVYVNGTVTVQGDIQLANADCAEEFDVASPAGAEPGTVMVLGDDQALYLALYPSSQPTIGGSPGWSPVAAITGPPWFLTATSLRGSGARWRLSGRSAAKSMPRPSRSMSGTC